LFFWKIVKIVATRCQILCPKCIKFDFGGVPHQTPLGELTALPQTTYLDLRGPTSKGRGRKGGQGRGGEGRGRSTCPPPRIDNPGYGPE